MTDVHAAAAATTTERPTAAAAASTIAALIGGHGAFRLLNLHVTRTSFLTVRTAQGAAHKIRPLSGPQFAAHLEPLPSHYYTHDPRSRRGAAARRIRGRVLPPGLPRLAVAGARAPPR